MNAITRCAALAILAGCSTTPHYDTHFGDAVRQAKSAMTIDPNAFANPDPATGIDGPSAVAAIKNYNAPPEPPPTLSLIVTHK